MANPAVHSSSIFLHPQQHLKGQLHFFNLLILLPLENIIKNLMSPEISVEEELQQTHFDVSETPEALSQTLITSCVQPTMHSLEM